MTPTWQINVGDCRDLLAELPAEHFHCVVTSPPYWGLRSYLPAGHANKHREIGSEPTPEEFVATMVEVFRGVRRVLRDDGVCWVNLGDSYNSGTTATRKPSRANNVGYWNSSGSTGDRRCADTSTPTGSLVGIPWRVALALQADGWILRADDIWHKASPMPESVRGWRWEKCRVRLGSSRTQLQGHAVATGKRDKKHGNLEDQPATEWAPCPGCRKCEPNGGLVLRRGSWRRTRAHEYVFQMVKTGDYFADGEAVAEPAAGNNGSSFTAGKSAHNKKRLGQGERDDNRTRNPRSVVTLSHEPYSDAHFACVDAETECLTIAGWRRYHEIKTGDLIFTYNMNTGLLEIEPVNQVAIYEYKGDLVSVYGRSSNMLLTPNHRCVVTRRNGRTKERYAPTFVRADSLKSGMKYPVAAVLDQSFLVERRDTTSFYELLGWFIAEGNYTRDGGAHLYQSESANADKVRRIERLLEYWPGCATRHVSKRITGTTIRWTLKGELRKAVKQAIPDKFRIPESLLLLPNAHLDAFLYGFISGDGNLRTDGRITFVQKSKQIADMVQAMYLRRGQSCVLSQRGCETWAGYVTKANGRHFRNAQSSLIRTDHQYHGIVWCPSVGNQTWVARRGGRPFITGNTFPPELVRPLLLASTSEKGCCPACGAQYARITERRQITRERPNDFVKRTGAEGTGNSCANTVDGVETVTLGWRATCGCDAGQPVPARVLDPFNGSGTTGMVARRLGLHYVGLELFEEYAEMARKRIKDDNPLLNAI